MILLSANYGDKMERGVLVIMQKLVNEKSGGGDVKGSNISYGKRVILNEEN